MTNNTADSGAAIPFTVAEALLLDRTHVQISELDSTGKYTAPTRQTPLFSTEQLTAMVTDPVWKTAKK